MTPRSISLVLTSLSALLFAAAVCAGEVSMDVRGPAAGSEQAPCPSLQTTDEASPVAAESGKAMTESNRPSRWNSADPAHHALVADGSEAAASTSSSAGGASSSAIAAPIKSRNRWQFLVPGAIK